MDLRPSTSAGVAITNLLGLSTALPYTSMEGQGVTNYASDRPSYAFSASTTEFDDALIRRGVITEEDALVAKGASREQAAKLLVHPKNNIVHQHVNDSDDGSDDDEFLVDDEFMTRYRKQRLEELCAAKPKAALFGDVVSISRSDWNREVNDDSQEHWVVVCLTSSDTERTGCCEAAVQELARKHSATKFVLIPAHQAIPNWPEDNLPTLFAYRDGRMQHQLVQLKGDISIMQLESILFELEVLRHF